MPEVTHEAGKSNGRGRIETVRLEFATARVSYAGIDRLDITRVSGKPPLGIYFAPSWLLLRPAISTRRRCRELRAAGNAELAEAIELEMWERYEHDYRREMLQSYHRHRAAWQVLLALPRAVLCCYCTDAQRCHRRLLAGYLVKLGARDLGEIGTA